MLQSEGRDRIESELRDRDITIGRRSTKATNVDDSEFRLCEECRKIYVVTEGQHVCGQAAPKSTKPHATGLFHTFLEGYYFPFLLRTTLRGLPVPATKCTPRFTIGWLFIFWLAVVGVSAAFGPNFLSLTRSGLDVPAGTSSATALNVLQEHYPQAGRLPPFVVLMTCDVPCDSTNSTRSVSASLAAFAVSQPEVIATVIGYWEFMNQGLGVLAEGTLSTDRKTMMSTVTLKKDAELKAITKTADELLDLTAEMSFPDIKVGTTGIFALFGEMSHETESNFAMIDGIALPIAVIILGLNLRSYKHMVVVGMNLGVTLLLAFALMVPIADAVDINPFSPSIMMSLGIAVCFDYSLFMLNRFREAVVLEKLGVQEAVFQTLESAGHVVVLSGLTLLATFLMLLIFPQNFLQSVGYSCSAVCLSAIIANMSITPMVLLAWPCLLSFKNDLSCCRKSPAKSENVNEIAMTELSKKPETPVAAQSEHNEPAADPVSPASSDASPEGVSPAPASPAAASSPDAAASPPSVSPSSASPQAGAKPKSAKKGPWCGMNRGLFFKLSWGVTMHPWIALLSALAVTSGFIYLWTTMIPTSDNAILFLQGSSSLNTLQTMTKSFDEGSLDPYSVIVVPGDGQPGAVLTSSYFDAESSLIDTLLRTQSTFLNTRSITALSYFGGSSINLTQCLSFFNPNSTAFNSSVAIAYRSVAGGLMNHDRSVSMVRMSTIVPPTSQAIVPFIEHTRDILTQGLKGGHQGYLIGAFTTTLDVQNALYALTPYLYASTVFIVLLIIAISFSSLFIAFRLAITIIVSLSWTYGLMALVYQPGPAQDAFAVIGPSLKGSSGVYWIIPIMSFSILVGLALDYDIFLMSRVMEFRRMGWSDRASICLAIEKTAGIITAAGVIMAVSFAGLLFPNTVALNQYGFSLCVGVTLDTFLVRTIMVPAVFAAFGKNDRLNWWPSTMPAPLLSPEEELEALRAGHWVPPSKYLTY